MNTKLCLKFSLLLKSNWHTTHRIWNHEHKPDREHIIRHPEKFSYCNVSLLVSNTPLPVLRQTLIYFVTTDQLHFCKFYVNAIIDFVLFFSVASFTLQLFWDSSILLHISIVLFFLLLNSIPLYDYTMIRLFNSPVDRQLDCLQILANRRTLLWIFVYSEHMLSFILDKYLGMQ